MVWVDLEIGVLKSDEEVSVFEIVEEEFESEVYICFLDVEIMVYDYNLFFFWNLII